MATLTIKIFDEIGGWGFNMQSLVEQLKGFKGNKINVPINSYGGSVLEGLAIFSTLKGRQEEINTSVVGYALSMGSIIAMAGDNVSMPENGYMMIHNPMNVAFGDANEMEKNAELLREFKNQLAKIYSKRTGLTLARINKMMDEETWLNAKDAKALGFIDKITPAAEFEASFDPSQFLNTPKELVSNQSTDMNFIDFINKTFGQSFTKEDDARAYAEGKKIQLEAIQEGANAKVVDTEEDPTNLGAGVEAPKGNDTPPPTVEDTPPVTPVEAGTAVATAEKNAAHISAMVDSITSLTDTVKGLVAKVEAMHEEKPKEEEKDAVAQQLEALNAQMNQFKGLKSGAQAKNQAGISGAIKPEDDNAGDVVQAKNSKEMIDQCLSGTVSSFATNRLN